jgi:hypothetical protein
LATLLKFSAGGECKHKLPNLVSDNLKKMQNYEEWDRNLRSNFLLLLFFAISVVHSDKKKFVGLQLFSQISYYFSVVYAENKKKLSSNKVHNAT